MRFGCAGSTALDAASASSQILVSRRPGQTARRPSESALRYMRAADWYCGACSRRPGHSRAISPARYRLDDPPACRVHGAASRSRLCPPSAMRTASRATARGLALDGAGPWRAGRNGKVRTASSTGFSTTTVTETALLSPDILRTNWPCSGGNNLAGADSVIRARSVLPRHHRTRCSP